MNCERRVQGLEVNENFEELENGMGCFRMKLFLYKIYFKAIVKTIGKLQKLF